MNPIAGLGLGLCLSLLPLGASADIDTIELKTLLQSNLQRSIDRMLIEGGFARIDFQTGQTQVFYPVDTHPQIIAMGDNFVMCSDLKRADGTSVTVDYYMVPDGKKFALVQTEINNRAPLMKLVENGLAQMLK